MTESRDTNPRPEAAEVSMRAEPTAEDRQPEGKDSGAEVRPLPRSGGTMRYSTVADTRKGKLHKKYLGSAFTAFAAVLCPLFVIVPIVFSIIVLTSELSAATVFLTIMCAAASLVYAKYTYDNRRQLYSWGNFGLNSVTVYALFCKKAVLSYEKCRGCGIGFYRHAFMNNVNSIAGTNVFYIFLSFDPFAERYRAQINRWLPSDTRIKVPFSKPLYDFLTGTLPKKQAAMLEHDYYQYIKRQ